MVLIIMNLVTECGGTDCLQFQGGASQFDYTMHPSWKACHTGSGFSFVPEILLRRAVGDSMDLSRNLSHLAHVFPSTVLYAAIISCHR